MSKRLFVCITCLLLSTIVLGACASASTPAPAATVEEQPAAQPEATGKKKAAVLFPGVVYDKSWNQAGYEGLQKAETECNLEIAFTEKVSQDAQIETFRNYAREGYDYIVGHGGEYYDAALTVAKEFPEANFIVTNATKGEGNLSGMAVSYPHQGYLAGALACEMTKTNKVAIVLAEPIPLAERGAQAFEMGAKSCGKDVQVETVATGSWDDVNKAREAALALIGNGVDVLFHILDTADIGVLTAAQDEGVMAVGLYSDQRSIAPNAVIGSAVGSPATLVYESVCGHVSNGQANYMDVNTPDGVSMVMTELVPEDIQQKIQQVTEDLKAGKITLP